MLISRRLTGRLLPNIGEIKFGKYNGISPQETCPSLSPWQEQGAGSFGGFQSHRQRLCSSLRRRKEKTIWSLWKWRRPGGEVIWPSPPSRRILWVWRSKPWVPGALLIRNQGQSQHCSQFFFRVIWRRKKFSTCSSGEGCPGATCTCGGVGGGTGRRATCRSSRWTIEHRSSLFVTTWFFKQGGIHCLIGAWNLFHQIYAFVASLQSFQDFWWCLSGERVYVRCEVSQETPRNMKASGVHELLSANHWSLRRCSYMRRSARQRWSSCGSWSPSS